VREGKRKVEESRWGTRRGKSGPRAHLRARNSSVPAKRAALHIGERRAHGAELEGARRRRDGGRACGILGWQAMPPHCAGQHAPCERADACGGGQEGGEEPRTVLFGASLKARSTMRAHILRVSKTPYIYLSPPNPQTHFIPENP